MNDYLQGEHEDANDFWQQLEEAWFSHKGKEKAREKARKEKEKIKEMANKMQTMQINNSHVLYLHLQELHKHQEATKVSLRIV